MSETHRADFVSKASDRRDSAGVPVHPSLEWLTTAETVGTGPDRQVLVVGDTVVGVFLCALLRDAGYDPLLLERPDQVVESRVTLLWSSTLGVLRTVGVSLRDIATVVDTVSVERIDSRRSHATLSREAAGEAEPVVVRTRDLRRALEAQLPVTQNRTNRRVGALSDEDDGVVVEFDDGVREWFDAVVDASGTSVVRRADRSSSSFTRLRQHEAAVDVDSSSDGVREVWCSDALAQRIPLPDGTESVVRITTPEGAMPTALDGTEWTEALSIEPDRLGSAVAETEPRAVRQLSLRGSGAERRWWGTGRIAFCGPSASPVAPASGLRVPLGIEDAVQLVVDLRQDSTSVSDAVSSYAAHRRDRLSEVRRQATKLRAEHEYPVRPPESPLSALGLLRTVALGSFCGPDLFALQRNAFE